MPLTPIDVANKQFRIAFRGYSLDEVDAFLDEVESELTRLLRQNNDLRQPGAAPARGSGGPVLLDKRTGADQPADTQPAGPPTAGAPLQPGEGQQAALRTLLIAQRTADEVVAEARAEAEQTRTEAEQTLTAARTEAEQLGASARTEAERVLTAARTEAEQTTSVVRAESERLLGSARAEAQRLSVEARAQRQRSDTELAARVEATMAPLEARRKQLEQHITDLRAFEREYRSRLKAYLEMQLRDLDGRDGTEDGGSGVPAAARAAALGVPAGGAPGMLRARPDSVDAPQAASPDTSPADGPDSADRTDPGSAADPVPVADPAPSAAETVAPFIPVPAAGDGGASRSESV